MDFGRDYYIYNQRVAMLVCLFSDGSWHYADMAVGWCCDPLFDRGVYVLGLSTPRLFGKYVISTKIAEVTPWGLLMFAAAQMMIVVRRISAETLDNMGVLLNSDTVEPTCGATAKHRFWRICWSNTMQPLIPFVLGVAVFAGAAQAQSRPHDVNRVAEGLIAVGMALELGDFCDDISVRKLRGLAFLQGLKSHLRDLGFSNAQIDGYIDDDDEKDRLEVIARARLSDLGVVTSDVTSYCRVARGQIAQATQVGQLLRD